LRQSQKKPKGNATVPEPQTIRKQQDAERSSNKDRWQREQNTLKNRQQVERPRQPSAAPHAAQPAARPAPQARPRRPGQPAGDSNQSPDFR
jgi:hypothetical protein